MLCAPQNIGRQNEATRARPTLLKSFESEDFMALTPRFWQTAILIARKSLPINKSRDLLPSRSERRERTETMG